MEVSLKSLEKDATLKGFERIVWDLNAGAEGSNLPGDIARQREPDVWVISGPVRHLGCGKRWVQDRAFWGGIEDPRNYVKSGADLPVPRVSGFDCMVASHLGSVAPILRTSEDIIDQVGETLVARKRELSL